MRTKEAAKFLRDNGYRAEADALEKHEELVAALKSTTDGFLSVCEANEDWCGSTDCRWCSGSAKTIEAARLALADFTT